MSRPLSTLPGVVGERLPIQQASLAAWFGIRRIGSVYYLLYALHPGVDSRLADLLVSPGDGRPS